MISAKRISILCLAASVLIAAALLQPTEARENPQIIWDPDDPLATLLGQSQAETTEVYFEDFSGGPSGWVPKDPKAQEAYWHQTTYDDGSGPRGVMWCGLEGLPWWVSGPGYGSSWRQSLTKSFTVPSGATIDYSVQYDTEPGFDSLYVQVSTDGGITYDSLAAYNGTSPSGFDYYSMDLSAYAGQTVVVNFYFKSDGSYDDEDGQWDTNGGARLDWVQVTGHPVDDFETDSDGWTATGLDPYPVQYRLEATPACEDTLPCSGYSNTWVAYDPATGVFPFSPTRDLELCIESPVIDIPAGMTQYILKFDVYANLPRQNLIFFSWEVAGPPLEQGGHWAGNNIVYDGTQGFHTRTFDITSYIQPGATQIRVRLYARDLCYTWNDVYGPCTYHTSAPMFDNVGIYCSMDPDLDRDGVPVPQDGCPSVNASPFDSDGDGCRDYGIGGRHVEYWDRGAFPLAYVINEDGCSTVGDGSEFTAIQQAMNAWTAAPGLDATVSFGGTTPQADADALDLVNLVTFNDSDYRFGIGVIAVGLTTSFTQPTEFGGTVYRPGQIIDSDMIFNPGKQFRTATDGPPDATYIEAVATHEAGHLFGIAHTPVVSSTMYFVLPPGLDAASLETEDLLTMHKAYATDLGSDNLLRGRLYDGYTGLRIPAAAVFAVDAATGDTVACEYTLPSTLNGTAVTYDFEFWGLPPGDYYVAVHPLDGSAAVGYVEPAYVNDLIAGCAQTVFIPEWYDAAESSTDDPTARTAVTMNEYSNEYVTIRTNIDAVPPEVVSTLPAPGETGVSVGTSVLVAFSEPVNDGTISGNFRLTDVGSGEFIAGNASVLNEDSLIAFIPGSGLAFSTSYKLQLDTGLEDKFGNGLAAPFEMLFTTEPEPDVALTSLLPSKGPAGILVSLNGKGFDPVPAVNIVTFGGVQAEILQASATQLVVTVPVGATSGVVHVHNIAQGKTSNDLQFTVLSPDEVPKGFDFATAGLSATPRAVTVLPNGSYAYMATDAGAQAVVVDPALSGYMTSVSIPISGGLSDVACTPAGHRVYGVSYSTQKMYRMDATPSSIGLLSERDIGAYPRGIAVHPKGHRAYIPTDEGEIGIWDIDEGSTTFQWKVGAIIPPDPNVRGGLATDPAGNVLLALSGTGKMLVFDLSTNQLVATVAVGGDPRDVAVDRVGQFAYVADGTGVVSVVSLANYTLQQTIRVGGSLRGIGVTPAGTFVYAVNREMNLLEAIDLRTTSQAYRSVATRIPLPINPIDIDLSPDGEYAFTVSEAEARLVITAVGLGPELATLSRVAGPVGSKAVLAGSDFLAGASTVVDFNGAAATPERYADNAITVTVPAAATSGTVSVVTSGLGEPSLRSNAAYFEVLGPTIGSALRLAATLPGKATPAADGGSVLQTSPAGDFIALADRSGGFHVLVTDPANPKYHQYAGSFNLGGVADDIAIAPGGELAFVVLPASGEIKILRTNRLKPDFLTALGPVSFSGIPGSSIARVAVSPDGTTLLVSDPGLAQVHFVDIVPSSPTAYQLVASVPLASGARNGVVREMAFHPGGAYAYLPVHDSDAAVVLVLDTSPTSPGYRTVVAEVALPGAVPQEIPVSLSFTPWGSRCLVLTSQQVSAPNRSALMLDTTDPASPSVAATLALGGTAAPAAEHIEVSPRGDRAIAAVGGAGLFNIRIQTAPDALTLIEQIGNPADYATTADLDYAPNAAKLYSLCEATDNLFVYDFSAVQTIAVLSGNGQAGVINEPLPKALRAQVGAGGGGSIAGVPVTFTVTSGGGHFAAAGSASQVVSTDGDGVAEVKWVLGPTVGAQAVQATATGLGGSPLTFTADGVPDPTTLPLTVAGVIPQDGTADVSVSSAMQVVFSRPVDPASVGPWSIFLRKGDYTEVSAVIGLADQNRRVSLSPRGGLEPNTTYWIEVVSGVTDADGGPLVGDVSSSFTTEPPPPLVLHSIAPISGSENVTVVISGSGFAEDPPLNQVLFNDLEAYVNSGGKDYLVATVPLRAATGTVRVVNTVTSETSNSLDFTVLTPDMMPINNVVTSIATGSGGHSVAITPDGAIAYAVSPYANRVVVIHLKKLAAIASIPVGENPVAIAIDPQGKFGYVANYVDGTVSVIDADRLSPTFNRVVDAVPVGGGPADLVVTPDGDGLVVANPVWGEVSFVDADPSSETYRSVVASVATGAGSSTVAITPDGGHIYVGTEFGYLVIAAGSRTVVSSISTGSGTSTIAITPDGALLVLLTTEGRVDIYDIRPGSPRENQVVSSIQTGSGTVNVAISPDGGLLYLVQSAGDLIFVVALDISGVVGVREDATELPPLQVQATVIDTLTAGEDPWDIAFDPTGSGNFIVTNAGDATLTVFGTPPPPEGPGTLAGRVTADCPSPDTGLLGVEVDVFTAGSGEMAASLHTTDDGSFYADLPAGDYTVTVVTPLGYATEAEETPATVAPAETTWTTFGLQCEAVVPDPRKMSYWKHQVAVALKGRGNADIDGPTLCSYLDLIEDHFNSNLLNPVVVYDPPVSGECEDKLLVAKDILNLEGRWEEGFFARQELLALLFNVASGKLHLASSISSDGATVSMAVTYVDHLIDDGKLLNNLLAIKIARDVNHGKTVWAGLIPLDTPNIMYIVRPVEFGVAQNGPNPFGGVTSIEFSLAEAAHARLAVYDVNGRLVRTLVDGRRQPGVYTAVWDGRDNHGTRVASGFYFYRFEAGRFSGTKKMILLN